MKQFDINRMMMAGLFAAASMAVPMIFSSCTDDIKFGNSFINKAPGGDVTVDTVFNNAEYTRQFLNACYSRQYYGITFATGRANSVDGWVGKFEAITDLYHLSYSNTSIYRDYYNGSRSAASSGKGYFGFVGEYVWETVRYCYLLLEHLNDVAGLSDKEKATMAAEAKCLIANRYFDAFMHYGGLPIIKSSFGGTESSYEIPRATVEETVDFMVNLLDEAIPSLPWTYAETSPNDVGHWTSAGAMALKCRILQFAASPLFNNEQGYYGGTSEAEQKHLVWYGDYKKERWTRLLQACENFMNALGTNGYYALEQADGTLPENYRLAFRKSYFYQGATDVLHSVRVTQKTNDTKYNFYSWVKNGRSAYWCTEEYMELFPWKDGTPFDWDKMIREGRQDEMFLVGDSDVTKKNLGLQNIRLTRDPRLYESMAVNGLPRNLDWSTGKMSGDAYEVWEGGTDSGTAASTQAETKKWGTSLLNMKFSLGDGNVTDYRQHLLQWPTIRLSDVYLTYAEALVQASDNYTEAVKQINKVRSRVGLNGFEMAYPEAMNNKEEFIKQLIDERAREMGFENSRFMDIMRYKRSDLLQKPLHGLIIYRLKYDTKSGKWERITSKWRNGTDGDSKKKKAYQPSKFDYEKTELKQKRAWWNNWDNKWFLSPLPNNEILKNYGLIQNPGW